MTENLSLTFDLCTFIELLQFLLKLGAASRDPSLLVARYVVVIGIKDLDGQVQINRGSQASKARVLD